MWSRAERDYHQSSYIWYKLDEKIIIRIWKRSSPELHYTARVYSKFNEGVNMEFFLYQDENLECLKLKCLLKAKDLGWNIKKII